MKGAILINSRHQTVKRFAGRVKADTGFDLIPAARCRRSLEDYDIIIVIGASRHAGSVSVREFIFRKTA